MTTHQRQIGNNLIICLLLKEDTKTIKYERFSKFMLSIVNGITYRRRLSHQYSVVPEYEAQKLRMAAHWLTAQDVQLDALMGEL